ncbi:MAG: hypothetical protein GY832_07350 [Chloroflexi bacterium]|nr:hypothetical protein [Chloroflexota bacterium]
MRHRELAVNTRLLLDIGIAVSVPTDCHKVYHPVPSPSPPPWSESAPSPSPPGLSQVVRWLVALGRGRWSVGWGVGVVGWGTARHC